MSLSAVNIEPIIQALKEIIQVHQQLFDISERKKKILIDGEVDALTQLLKEEAKLVKELGKCEEERAFQVKQYLLKKGIAEKDITLLQLIDLVINPMEKRVLQKQFDELQEKVIQMQEINQLNTRLIEDSLAYVTHSIEVMTDIRSEEINYKKPNQGKSSPSGSGRGFFDQKA